MFKSSELESELTYSHTIDNQQAVWVEWNLNQSYNISRVGNYRYRPGTTDSNFRTIRSIYEETDPINAENSFKGYYTGATDADIVINAGFDDADQPAYYIAKKKKINLLYSLDDCFNQERPRSGINKLLYLGVAGSSYIDSLTTRGTKEDPEYLSTVNIARRPRYYISSRYDDFKYWTSYRTEAENLISIDGKMKVINNEFGIALKNSTGTATNSHYIYDAAPFVVYNESVPSNKIVVKMQTNVGEINNGPFRFRDKPSVPDPLYGEANKTVPRRWSIQKLDENNNWITLISFDEGDVRLDGSAIIGSDGHVEIEYGLIVPDAVEQQTFTLIGETYTSTVFENVVAPIGYAYLLKENVNDKGILRISDGSGSWNPYPANYKWSLASVDITKSTKVVTKLSDPDYFYEGTEKIYREFQFIKGLRIVVDTMNKVNSTFDLIELSPRLVSDITKKTISYSVKKTLSDLGSYSMPTGNLLASTGNISLFDDDLSFNENNSFNHETSKGSIISKYSDSKIKFLFYDIVKNINYYDYYIPVKTLYSERIPQVSDNAAQISMDLRDLFYLLESKKAPELLLTNVSLSYAITVLLDSIGFSNYVFKRTSEDEELIIPYFFVGPQQNIAEVLQQLAMSSQSAIFFDEFNNLVVMSKNYLLPSATARPTDITLYGQEVDTVVNGLVKTKLPNILNLSSQDKLVYNGGEINYTTRYIQKSIGSIAQAPYIDDYKTFIYKPVLLWEVAGQQATKTTNESATRASGYSLSAMPIKTKLTSNLPQIVDGNIINNIIDFGESVYWLGNYSGYFYANSEIIKYDAVEYSVAGVGNVWIKNNQEYQNYFSNLKFNGKMYATGRVRIYTNIKDGIIKEHGRGQFGTSVVEHAAGIEEDSSWVIDNNVRGCIQNTSDYLFNSNRNISYPKDTGIEKAGNAKVIGGQEYTSASYAIKSTRNGIIKNFMANTNITEKDVNYYKTAWAGSVQTSALVFNGPTLPDAVNPTDFVTYSYKELDKPYKHFGTRIRIVGKVESGTNQNQTPIGAFNIYSPSSLSSEDPSKQISIVGGSGGVAFNLNKDTNIGYYFEIAALSQNNVSSYNNNSNIVSYEILKSPITTCVNGLVTVSTKTQHDFEIGSIVTISGLVDDDRKTSPTSLNGEFTITEISSDRKLFKYQIPPVSSVQNIVKAVHDTELTTYTITSDAFKAGDLVNIAGLTSSYNGNNLVVQAISTTKEQKIINAVSANGTYITYTTTSNHGFFPGQEVNVSGIVATADPGENADAYNWQKAFIYDTPTSNTFRIASNLNSATLPISDPDGTATVTCYNIIVQKVPSDSSPAADGTGTMTFVPLNTNASTGGTASKVLDTDSLISNVFFYKIVSGSNTADVIKKKRISVTEGSVTYGLVTLTTLKTHSLQIGERVIVSGVDSNLNGEYEITGITDKTISYKTVSSTAITEADVNPIGLISSKNKIAIPEIIWRGFTDVLVDDGKFTTQSRLTASEKTTVYDLAAESMDIGTTRQFFLYLNGKQVAVVTDTNPLPKYNNMALFVRGSSRLMFENVYALSDNFAESKKNGIQLPISENNISAENDVIRNYSLNGIIQSTYLSGISSENPPEYSLYYEEFGTIMREAAYFNIKYDRAFPALYSKLADTLNRVRGYTVSGFLSGSYGAEFLIFNAIDKNLNLDDTSGNYLRILGIAFTQNTTHSLKVDDFFKKNSNFADDIYNGTTSAATYQKLYTDVQNSRNKYGRKDFSIEAPFVQTDAAAESMMDWVIEKVIYPRKTVGINVFATPHIQLGDIVTLNYVDNGINIVTDSSTRFVVYNIETSKQNNQNSMTIYLAEV